MHKCGGLIESAALTSGSVVPFLLNSQMVFRNVCYDTASSIRRIIYIYIYLYITTYIQDKNLLPSSDGVTSSCCAISRIVYTVYYTHIHIIYVYIMSNCECFFTLCAMNVHRVLSIIPEGTGNVQGENLLIKRSVSFSSLRRFGVGYIILCYKLNSQSRLCIHMYIAEASAYIRYVYVIYTLCFKLFACNEINALLMCSHF